MGVFSETDAWSQQRCLLDTRFSAEFSDKMHKFLKSQAEYLVALAFLCCHYIFGSYVTCLTLSSNFLCIYSLEQQLFQPFKSFIYQSRCSLEPKNFLKDLCPWTPCRGAQTDSQLLWCLRFHFFFYLILFQSGFSYVHLGQLHEINLFWIITNSNILFGILSR